MHFICSPFDLNTWKLQWNFSKRFSERNVNSEQNTGMFEIERRRTDCWQSIWIKSKVHIINLVLSSVNVFAYFQAIALNESNLIMRFNRKHMFSSRQKTAAKRLSFPMKQSILAFNGILEQKCIIRDTDLNKFVGDYRFIFVCNV